MTDRSRTAELVMRHLGRATATSPRGLRRLALSALRRGWLRIDDPDIRFDLDGSSLLVPFSHELPVHRAAHPDYSANLGRIAGHIGRHRPGTIIDIGANVGDSVAIIRPHSDAPILCIEGDEVYLPYLRANTDGVTGVAVEPSYVATSNRHVRYAVERIGGTARLVPVPITDDGSPGPSAGPTGTTPPDAAEATDAAEAVEAVDLDTILARHPALPPPALVKIDTDGNDPGIIRAAQSLLERDHPVLFFEFDPHLIQSVGGDAGVFALLHELGYSDLLVFANTGGLLCHASPTDQELLDDLASFVGEDRPIQYFDICALHADDHAVALELRLAEQARPARSPVKSGQ